MWLSIDQSISSSGVILWDKDKVKEFKLIKTPASMETIIRLRAIINNLQQYATQHKVTHIVVESLPYGAVSTSVRMLAALYYFIHNLCLDLSITFSEANVTGVKKLATGSGKADKAAMVNALLEQAPTLHTSIINEGIKKTTGLADLADAYFIGAYYIKEKNDVSK